MGKTIDSFTFQRVGSSGLMKPIIYCNASEDVLSRAVSINKKLAIELSALRPKRRTIQLEACFQRVLAQLPDDTVIRDFDVMFNPAYQVDVLRVLVNANKKKPFSAIWCGRYEDGKLIYAEEGYLDFRTFYIDNYDVTCVI